LTSMGMKEPEMEQIAAWIDHVCRNISRIDDEAARIRVEIADFCDMFHVPGYYR